MNPSSNQLPAPNGQPSDPFVPQKQPGGSYQAPPTAVAVTSPTNTGSPGVMAVPMKSNPNSTQNTLQIAEIRDGIVIMNDGSFRAVVMVKSINFDLMSSQEREGVEFSFQGFLNALYFPIQIFVRTQRVDLRPYLEKLDKLRSEQDNMLLAMLMEDYLGYIDNLAAQTNIMDKRSYLVVPFFPFEETQNPLIQSKSFFSGLAGLFSSKELHVNIDEPTLAKAKDELRNRIQSVMGGLQQCGVQSLPLDTQELIELYYDAYNPDTATRQQLKNFDDLTAPVVTKGTGEAPTPNLDKVVM